MKNDYLLDIINYTEKLLKEIKDELLLVLPIGSSCSDKVIVNWSDIDMIIVLKNYTFSIVEKISQIANSFSVKIGNTIYSETEFTKKQIDSKTFYHLYLLNNNIIKYQYKCDSLHIPVISIDEVRMNITPHLYDKVHNLKRMFLYNKLEKKDIRTIFKTTYIVMKSMLILNSLFPKNYKETFTMFSKKYNIDYYDYEEFIRNFMEDNRNYENIVEYSKKILLNIV